MDVSQAKRLLAARRFLYHRTFSNPPGQGVLRDLAIFCRAAESTFHENERAHALAEGRREVWLRIQQHLQLSESDLWDLLSGGDNAA